MLPACVHALLEITASAIYIEQVTFFLGQMFGDASENFQPQYVTCRDGPSMSCEGCLRAFSYTGRFKKKGSKKKHHCGDHHHNNAPDPFNQELLPTACS